MNKLAVSSIAWTNEEEVAVAETLRELGVKYVELALTKIWDDPTMATDKELADYKAFWLGYGIEVVAFQSMLFAKPELKIFESEELRNEALKFLKDFIVVAGKMGARVLVFGSPKNRQRGSMSAEEADKIAKEFFGCLGDAASQNNTSFCIEPNPTDYACDYVINAQQGIDLVEVVSNHGFGLHLDIAGMTLAGDNIAESIKKAAPILRHFHASSPNLELVQESDGVNHNAAAQALKEVDYQGFVSIEMRPGEAGTNAQRVRQAVTYIQGIYGPQLG